MSSLPKDVKETCQNVFKSGTYRDECSCMTKVPESTFSEFKDCRVHKYANGNLYEDWFACNNDTTDDCSDVHVGEYSCNQYFSWDYCNNGYADWMALNCKKTCKKCEDASSGGDNPGDCKDTHSGQYSCDQYKSWNYCKGGYVDWMKENCADTCGHCKGGEPSSKPSGKPSGDKDKDKDCGKPGKMKKPVLNGKKVKKTYDPCACAAECEKRESVTGWMFQEGPIKNGKQRPGNCKCIEKFKKIAKSDKSTWTVGEL
eukprot:TRINITY_DN288_c0_g1_i1.p1 TRINITY_DN288_c0_g1~~TRINITY_DN288_c0_g1_i1.p1  ORF type:complete len:257 (+),score=77.39 TRINITY_DN288_c0_g1_i1:665-1435(+)